MNFQTQKKILEPLLKNSKNSNCADCNASTPSCTFIVIQGHRSTSVFLYVQTVRGPIEL